MAFKLPAQRIQGPYGTDYRVGDYVVIKDDTEVVDPTDYDGFEVISRVTWGAVPATTYDARGGSVGLPDSVFEAGTLRKVREWIESRAT